MTRRPRKNGASEDALEVGIEGYALVNTPMLNKGSAFPDAERDLFHLHGILPSHVFTLEEQAARRLKVLGTFATDLQRYLYLRDLQDTNETLFYWVLTSNLESMLPLVYTPTVGEGCQRFSEIWRKPRGLFVSYPNRRRIREILSAPHLEKARVIVVSDGERILGLGDQGAGGMGIPIGKLSLYTACAGIHPEMTLPILLDVGTNNEELIADPIYIGWRHERVRGADYDAFVEEFVNAVAERWPNMLLQWEDFSKANAERLLLRYRGRMCTFNDDIQGTAAVAAATLLAAVGVSGVPLAEQRIVIFGAGSAGCGIAALVLQAMGNAGLDSRDARGRFFLVDQQGLLVEGMQPIEPAQRPFLQPREAVSAWKLRTPGSIGLLDVIVNARPTTLIGASGQPQTFTEPIVREMSRHVERPVILPLSNPSSRSEATPEQLLTWTQGRALIGSGSPFAPVRYRGRDIAAVQTNNSYIFPGVGLGVLACGARRVTDGMFMAAALALAERSPALMDRNAPLLPPIRELRDVAAAVARSVALQAQKDGVAESLDARAVEERIRRMMWTPRYRPYRRAKRSSGAPARRQPRS